jgi:hypothetical protein
VLILKIVKVVCFDTLLQVFILNRLAEGWFCHPPRVEDFGDRIKNEPKKRKGGGYPIPGILQRVRKRLISIELEETPV